MKRTLPRNKISDFFGLKVLVCEKHEKNFFFRFLFCSFYAEFSYPIIKFMKGLVWKILFFLFFVRNCVSLTSVLNFGRFFGLLFRRRLLWPSPTAGACTPGCSSRSARPLFVVLRCFLRSPVCPVCECSGPAVASSPPIPSAAVTVRSLTSVR